MLIILGFLIEKLASILGDYCQDNEFYIESMTSVFYYGGKHVNPSFVYNMILLLAEGMTGDEEVDNTMRIYAVNYYFDFLLTHAGRPLPYSLEMLISWILGEYR